MCAFPLAAVVYPCVSTGPDLQADE